MAALPWRRSSAPPAQGPPSPAATAKVRPSAVPASRALSRAEVADIMAMLAASAHPVSYTHLGELTWAAGELTELRRRLEQESRQREKLWFAGLFSGAGLLLILLI